MRLVLIGLVAGIFSSLFGVGGGIVIVPLLILVAAFGTREATATSLGAIVITALAGVTLYASAARSTSRYAAARRASRRWAGALIGTVAPAAALRPRADAGASPCLLAAVGVWLIAG